MSFVSIPQQQLEVLKKILAQLEHEHDPDTNRLLHAILEEQRETTRAIRHQTPILRQIRDALTSEPTLTDSVANVFTGASPMADNVLEMNVGDVYTDTITPRLADGVTPSGGVLSNVVIDYTDPSATFVINSDNTVSFTAVSATTSPVSGSTSCTVTDTDGAVSQWNIAFTVSVAGVVPPEQLTQSVANVFTKA